AIACTYGDLHRRAGAIARVLCEHFGPPAAGGERPRVLLVYPPGLDFVAGFFACLQTGLIAVPVPPPRRHQDADRWQHIVADAVPAAVLTTAKLRDALGPLLIHAGHCAGSAVPCWETDRLPDATIGHDVAAVEVDGIAMLQYTSGSTRQPQGVCVTHANLHHNLGVIHRVFGHGPDSRGVIWLPPYHDMGLIGGILQPVFSGFPVTLMAPAAFLRRPVRWLEAISHFRATTSGGPNFAYEHCLRRIAPQDREGLDLSPWTVAFSGAETVRSGTLKRFAAAFAAHGFRAEAFLPCYGLAEATLMVSGVRRHGQPTTLHVDRDALRGDRVQMVPTTSATAQPLVACGGVVDGLELRVVDPSTRRPVEDGHVGELWVTGASVAPGYWRSEAGSAAVFDGRLATGNDPRPFLRTGDLGFRHEDALYVTGRLRDLIVIRGANHAPQDIELSVEHSHPDLATGGGAAFTVDHDEEPRLVVVHEVEREAWRRLEPAAVFDAIRAAVSRDHGLQVRVIVLVKPGSLPKTPSGKVRRRRCAADFAAGELTSLARWPLDGVVAVPVSKPAAMVEPAVAAAPAALLEWLRDYADTSLNSRLMDERRSLSPGVVLDFGNRGLLGMQVPASHGGLGFGHRAMRQVIEQLGAIDATLGLFVGLNNVLGVRPILRHGDAALRDELLPQLAAGRELAAFALTEEGAGSHPHGITASATPRAGGWSLNGTKIWSGSAAWAGVTHVFVREVDGSGHAIGISGFAVRKGRPGLRQGAEAPTMGMRGMVQNAVHLNDVPVGAADRLGGAGEGMAVAQDAMMYGRLTIAAACVGGMKRCAQLMLRYGARRSIATGRLLDHPVTLTRLSGLTAGITALGALVDAVCERLDRGAAVPEEVYAACKILGPEWYWRATDDLMQCLGGRGYIETNLAPQMLRDARVLRIFEGPTEALAMYLGARTLRQPATLDGFLADALGMPDIASALRSVAERAAARHATTSAPFVDAVTAQRRTCVAVGEVAAWAIVRAALGASAVRDAGWRRGMDWTQARFDIAADRALRDSAEESVLLSPGAVTQWIAGYRDSIGDIEQALAGEDGDLDAWLRRAGTASPRGATPAPASGESGQPAPAVARSAATIRRWLTTWLARHLRFPETDIDPHKAFADYGVDSVMAVELARDLELELALADPLEPTLAWNHPTLHALAEHLAQLGAAAPPVTDFATSAGRSVATAGADADLDDLSEAELADLLAAEITGAGPGRR
ncbi:MAG: AMP-binding protein, partial [Burkholderiales bacterium]|nr:AMP-binding protein [Burkholderiales bacterium]